MNQPVYRGRFAPSPTGLLHFGSIVAAVGSRLEAKNRNGAWLVRIEDLDTPRNAPGAANGILHQLEALGLHWDEAETWQSRRIEYYRDALHRLDAMHAAYPCSCSRREISGIYPGTCRGKKGLANGKSVRVKVGPEPIFFDDGIQGKVTQNLASEVGDFVVLRADGIFAYQLAVVVDDALQKITHVVRGADLLDSTPRQIHLQRLLGLQQPEYCHLPVAVNANGEKLSKQTLAAPVDPKNPLPVLLRALEFLGQNPPKELRDCNLDSFWNWAITNWDSRRIAKLAALPEGD